jgi:hypothetical protein
MDAAGCRGADILKCTGFREDRSYEACEDIKYQESSEHSEKGRLRRMPDILPVCLQDQLHSWKSELRSEEIMQSVFGTDCINWDIMSAAAITPLLVLCL